MNEDILARLVLKNVPGFGPAAWEAFSEIFDSPAAMLHADEGVLLKAGLGQAAISAIADSVRRAVAQKEIEDASREGIRILTPESDEYPAAFRRLHRAPSLLYVRGRLDDGPRIAMVGTRLASRDGLRNARAFAAEFAGAGIDVVSGLARGIDTAAHEGALAGGGRTIAVLGSGHLALYPEENRLLAARIVERGGAIVSEFSLREEARNFHFPMRNRLISALADAVLVVEAPKKSGALITAGYALEEGKDVFAVPGPLYPSSEGSNRLIQDGAFCALGASDVCFRMGWRKKITRLENPDAALNSDPVVVAAGRIGEGALEDLARESGMAPAEFLAHLSDLETKGMFTAGRGGITRRPKVP